MSFQKSFVRRLRRAVDHSVAGSRWCKQNPYMRVEPLEERRLLAWTPVHTGSPQGPNSGVWSPDPPNDLQDETATLTFSNLPAHTHIRAGFDIPAYDGWGDSSELDITGQLAGHDVALDYWWITEWGGSPAENPFAHTDSSADVTLTGSGFADTGYMWHARYTWVDVFTPVVSISGGGEMTEDGGPLTFTVSRDGDATVWDQQLTVQLQPPEGLATNGADYTGVPESVTIPAGQGSTTFQVSPINDEDCEPNEDIIVGLAEPAANANYKLAGQVGDPNVTIQNWVKDDVSVKEIEVSVNGYDTRAYGYSFNVDVVVTGENVDQLEIRQLIKTSQTQTDWNGANMTVQQIEAEYGAGVATDTAGQYVVDTNWDWQGVGADEGTNKGQSTKTDSQVHNVTHREVEVNGHLYDQVKLNSTTRDFKIEVRKGGTVDVLKTFSWGYSWNNSNATWTNQQADPPPDPSCARSDLGFGAFEDDYGVQGLP